MSIIYFDICAGILTGFMIITLTMQRNSEMHQNLVFFHLAYVILFASLGSFIEAVGVNRASMGYHDLTTSQATLDAGVYLYLACHIAVPLLTMLYVRSVMNIHVLNIVNMVLLYTPISAAYVLLILNPVNHGVFSHSNGIYSRGPLMTVFYVVTALYVVIALCIVFRYRNNVLSSVVIAFMSFAVLSVSALLIQYVIEGSNIENFMNALSLLIVYLTIERPGDRIDISSGLQNDYSFYVNSSIMLKRTRTARFLAITIDNIDFVESNMGREAAEEFLRQIGHYLGSVSREVTAYRIEEYMFVLVFNERARISHVELMEEIRRRFSGPFSADRYSMIFFECVMYICSPDDVKDAEELRRLLNIFGDRSRHGMKHVVQVSSIDLDREKRDRDIGSLLTTAIEDDRFAIRYQPVRNIRTGSFDSVEMKPLIDSPDMGLISHSEYYFIAAGNGTLIKLVKHIINTGFACVSENDLQRKIRNMVIPIPVSFLMMKNAPDWVRRHAREWGVSPSFITFGVSENILIRYTDAVRESINAMHEDGFSFMLMNFGSGYMDIEKMMNMHLGGVCISRDLISSAVSSEKADILVRDTADLMESMHMDLRVNGIDSEELKAYAQSVGIEWVQGFAVARFYTGESLTDFLEKDTGKEGKA